MLLKYQKQVKELAKRGDIGNDVARRTDLPLWKLAEKMEVREETLYKILSGESPLSFTILGGLKKLFGRRESYWTELDRRTFGVSLYDWDKGKVPKD